ncbi:MAG: hypothetical protein J6L88_03775 [Clostridia bacterium]|nr:hypothetical protein [Clostridia bacterium]
MFCTNCGHEVQGKFCTNCGKPVDAAPAAPVAETPVPEAPQAPVYEAPAAPAYEAPQAPVYEAPQAPVYEAPAQPQYAPPQQYAAPQYTAPAPKQKKSMSAGKIVLIVLLSLLAVIILLVAACSILVGKAANDVVDEFESAGIVAEDIFSPTEENAVADAPEEEAIVPSTGELVYYEGLTYITVDSASYVGDDIVAELTLWNECEFGIDQVKDLMIRLYDTDGTAIATGNFFFDSILSDGYIIENGDYIEFTVTFEDAVTGCDLSDCSVAYELMAHMYNDAGQVIGERVVTRMFEISLPAEWVGKVDYYMPDNAYGFYSIANDAAGADGTLFFIEYYEPGTYTGSGELIGEDSWYEYYLTYPAGTPYDTSDAALSAEYELFASQIDQVIYTINIF